MDRETKLGITLLITAVILLFFFLLITTNESESHENQLRVSRIVKVYDGDTVYVDIDGLPPVFGKNIGVRIPGIDTPEMKISLSITGEKRKCLKEMGKEAKRYLYVFLTSGADLYLVEPKRDKYFRLNADILVNGKSAKEYMLASPYARPYDGGFKPMWECKSE
jgi:micrococcal nuclease